ncbi:MAG: excisionase [Eubacterium sp.]|nr:excisionase [Eubacterium sp.]
MAGKKNRYVLMHKQIPVAQMELDAVSGAVLSVGEVYNTAHVPVGILPRHGSIDRSALNAWWRGRAIPASRAGIREALYKMQVADTQLLLEKCMGLSLSDQYWICPAGAEISWEQVNFFVHPFSEDVGNMLFGKAAKGAKASLMSPDNTSDGWLKKKWVLAGGRRCLLKGGSGAVWQEPYNEVFASRLMERLHIPHVAYELVMEDGYPYSICEDFITPDTELISAWYVMQTVKKPNHVSVYKHYLDCCERLGVPGIREAVDRMIVADYLIVNEDRHQNNFGVVRRADSLAYLGAAPIYDSGTSLWFDKPVAMIQAGAKVSCKPFKSSHEQQVQLVSDFSWLDFCALSGIEEEWREIVKGSVFVEQARCEAICKGLSERVKWLEGAARAAKPQAFVDHTRFDIRKDVAYGGYSSKQA